MATTKVSVRMYNVGFGDAFLVTVEQESKAWRALIDCGVHPQGQANRLPDIVKAIIGDLTKASADDVPRLDVIVATHHHADHIAGFALDDWSEVEVGEVWVPFVEDETDADARLIRTKQARAAQRLRGLLGLLDDETSAVPDDDLPFEVVAAQAFALNSSGNAVATERLLGRNGRSFRTAHDVRYLPATQRDENVIDTGVPGVRVHVLGPTRDPAMLKRMDPPKSASWLALDCDDPIMDRTRVPLFAKSYEMGAEQLQAERYSHLTDDKKALNDFNKVHDVDVLAAASILERSVNNTSLFLVLDVDGTHLLFPGDAQQGAWDHVLGDPANKAMLEDVAFFKIGHHGSHNGTPKPYIEGVLHDGAEAMLPWGLVERWKQTIPKTELLASLKEHHHHVTRADQPKRQAGKVYVHQDIWSEVRLTC